MTVELAELNGSGESGTATLTGTDGGKTRVVLDLKNPTTGSQPAHIHRGNCAKLDPKPRYGLVNAMDGKSETIVGEPLSELTGGGLAINVHQSNDDLGTYVACGNLPGGAGGGADTGGGSGYSYRSADGGTAPGGGPSLPSSA